MGTETGTILLDLAGRELECEFERYVEERGEDGRTGYFSVTRATLVCSAFIGHDPVRIDLTSLIEKLGGTDELDSLAEAAFLSSDSSAEASEDGYRENEDAPVPSRRLPRPG